MITFLVFTIGHSSSSASGAVAYRPNHEEEQIEQEPFFFENTQNSDFLTVTRKIVKRFEVRCCLGMKHRTITKGTNPRRSFTRTYVSHVLRRRTIFVYYCALTLEWQLMQLEGKNLRNFLANDNDSIKSNSVHTQPCHPNAPLRMAGSTFARNRGFPPSEVSGRSSMNAGSFSFLSKHVSRGLLGLGGGPARIAEAGCAEGTIAVSLSRNNLRKTTDTH